MASSRWCGSIVVCRFGSPPPAIFAAIDATDDAETLDRWADLFEVSSPDEITNALAAG
jgi:hypothetical protein